MKKLPIILALLVTSACNTKTTEAKTPFNLAIDECLNQVRIGDGHTNQEISKCVAKADGVCAEPTGFTGAFGDKIGWDFVKKSSLTCLNSSEEINEVCEISTWTNFIPEKDRDPEKGIFAEQPQFNINCLIIAKWP